MKTRSDDLNSLGCVLRAFRHRKGLSQEELGWRANVHRTYVGGVERGERNPSVLTLQRLLVAVGVSWEEFGREFEAARDRPKGQSSNEE